MVKIYHLNGSWARTGARLWNSLQSTAQVEALHPEARKGGDRGNQYTGGKPRQSETVSFASDTAAKTGLSPQAIQQDVQIATRVAANVARRQMDPETKRRQAGRLRERGWSSRRIERVLGVDQATIVRWADETRSGDADASPERVVGADGKTYPAEQDADDARARRRAHMRVLTRRRREASMLVSALLGGFVSETS